MIKGIDISQFQGNVDFNALKQNENFVMIRANFGDPDNTQQLNEDADFQRNRDGARASGILHGFYHYAYPEYNAPEAEADFFSSILSDLQIGEVLALDFEEPYNGDHVAWVKTFLERVSSHFNGYKPLLYINYNEATTHDWSPVIKDNDGIWLAAWDGTTNDAYPAVQWPVLAIKQYADNTQVPGISGNVDSDVFYGDGTVFNDYAYSKLGQSPAPTLAPTPVPTFTQADIDASFQKGAQSRQAEIDALNTQLQSAQTTVSQDTSAISQDETTIQNDTTQETTLEGRITTLEGQVAELTKELQAKGQIVPPLQPGENLLERVVNFFESLMGKGAK